MNKQDESTDDFDARTMGYCIVALVVILTLAAIGAVLS